VEAVSVLCGKGGHDIVVGELSPSAHRDTFCRDHLPPPRTWPEFEFTLPELRYPARLNCAAALLDGTVRRLGAGRTCLIAGGERWTYGDLLHRPTQVAQVLTGDLGLVPGQRVLLRGPSNPWLVACWLGVLKAGGVVVTTMPLLRSAELRTLIGLTRPAVARCDHRIAHELAEASGDVTAVLYGGPGSADLVSRAAARPGESRWRRRTRRS